MPDIKDFFRPEQTDLSGQPSYSSMTTQQPLQRSDSLELSECGLLRHHSNTQAPGEVFGNGMLVKPKVGLLSKNTGGTSSRNVQSRLWIHHLDLNASAPSLGQLCFFNQQQSVLLSSLLCRSKGQHALTTIWCIQTTQRKESGLLTCRPTELNQDVPSGAFPATCAAARAKVRPSFLAVPRNQRTAWLGCGTNSRPGHSSHAGQLWANFGHPLQLETKLGL